MSYVQGNATNLTSTGTTIPISLTGVAAGALLVVGVSFSEAAETATCADGEGSFAAADDIVNGNFRLYLFHRIHTAGGSVTATVTFSGAVGNREVVIAEYSDMDATPLDDAAAGAIGSSATPDSGTINPVEDGDTVIGVTWYDPSGATIAAGSNLTFTKRQESAGATHCAIEDAVQTTAAAVSADWLISASRDWAATGAAYKAAPGGPPPSVCRIIGP